MGKAVAVRDKFEVAKRRVAELAVEGKDVVLSDLPLLGFTVHVNRPGGKVYAAQPRERKGDVAVRRRVLDCKEGGWHSRRVLPDGIVALGTIPEAGDWRLCRA